MRIFKKTLKNKNDNRDLPYHILKCLKIVLTKALQLISKQTDPQNKVESIEIKAFAI